MTTDNESFKERAKRASWSWDSAESRAVVNEILAEAAARFDNAKIVERDDEEVVDLRAKFRGVSVRFSLWSQFHCIEAKIEDSGHTFELKRDLEQVPKGKVEDDPWDEDEDRRVFVGKGIFVEGDDDEVKERLTAWGQLCTKSQEGLLEAMGKLNVSVVQLFDEDIMLASDFHLEDVDDPAAYLEDLAELMLLLEELGSEEKRISDDDDGAVISATSATSPR